MRHHPENSRSLYRETGTDLDQIVGDNPEPYPTLHPFEATVATTIQSVATFQHTDASFTSRPPFLSGAEPPPPLQLPPFFAMRAAVGNRHPRYAHFLNLLLIGMRVEAGIGRHYSGHAPEAPLMFLDGWHQQFLIARAVGEYSIVRDDLVLGFLHFHQLAELRGLAQLPLPNNLRMRLEHADQLPRKTSDPFENTRSGLLHYLLHSIGHRRQSLRQRLNPSAARTRKLFDFP